MSADQNSFTPPVPRDQSGPTMSEVIPFRSQKINIWKSKALLPLMIAALAVVAMFATMNSPLTFIKIVAWLVVVSIFLGVYFYSGMQKQWLWYLVPGLFSGLAFHYTFIVYEIVFRQILPGNVAAIEGNTDFITNFVAYFFAAGLCEESYKATPVLIALGLALWRPAAVAGPAPGLIDVVRGKTGASGMLGAIALRSPLDGMLMGLAAGGAFILNETLGEYVPNQMEQVYQKSHDVGAALFQGLELAIPRVLQGVSGHMTWAAIFGYFIGLSARYPRRAVTLIPIGFLIAALLHTLWDTVDNLPTGQFGYVVVSVATVLIFVACLLKAKQLELAWGGGTALGDSILVGMPMPGTARVPAPATSAPQVPVGGVLSGLQGVASGLEAVAGGAIRPTVPPPAPIAAPAAVGSRFSIGAGETRYAVEAGQVVDFGALFGAKGAPAGTTGEINHHPKDPTILGLRNTGAAAWAATTPEGSTITVPPGKNLRIAAGTRLNFGALTLDMQSY